MPINDQSNTLFTVRPCFVQFCAQQMSNAIKDIIVFAAELIEG